MTEDTQMIIVLGSVRGSADTFDELLEASLAHVRRSRTEPGCLEHGVHRDVQDPLRLVFVERWQDRQALDRHFAVPGSVAFVAAVRRLAAGPPTLTVHEVAAPA